MRLRTKFFHVSELVEVEGLPRGSFGLATSPLTAVRNPALLRKGRWTRTICTILVQTQFFLRDRPAVQTSELMAVRVIGAVGVERDPQTTKSRGLMALQPPAKSNC
jgi:hypothetical protein